MSDVDHERYAVTETALRERVVEAAGQLGWGLDSISRFARALMGKAWDECGEEELHEMLQEYEVLIEVVEAKRARERVPERSAQATPPSEPARDRNAGPGRMTS